MAGSQFDPEIVKIWSKIPENELAALKKPAFPLPLVSHKPQNTTYQYENQFSLLQPNFFVP